MWGQDSWIVPWFVTILGAKGIFFGEDSGVILPKWIEISNSYNVHGGLVSTLLFSQFDKGRII